MRYIMLCCLLAGGITISAQEFQFGIGMSIASSEINAPGLTGEQLSVTGSSPNLEAGIGFSLNIYSRWLINDWLSLNSAPTIAFQGSKLYYLNQNNTRVESELYPVGVVLPVAFEISPGTGKWQPHFSAGAGVFLNLENKDDPAALELRKNLLFGQLSAGVSCTTSKFIIRPELVYWHSLVNPLESESIRETLGADWQYIGLRVLFYGNRNI